MKIIVVGGGIGGLAAAIGLSRAGHTVKVLERSSFSREIGAAINVCPNASRILLEWGFDPKASRMVTAQEQKVVVGTTMQALVMVDCSNFDQTYGAAFYLAHRVDLHNELRRIAAAAGDRVEILLAHDVVAYDVDGSVTLKDGSKLTADLVVAADGVHSSAARVINSNAATAVPTGQSAFRFLIPTADLADDPRTAPLLEDGVMKVFTGHDGRRLVCYPCAGHALQNFVGIHPTPADITAPSEKEDWNLNATCEDVTAQYADFHPAILSAISKATSIKRWPLLYREPMSSWTSGRLVLVGDAAHPMLPHQGQGGAQAIEDAGALHSVFIGMHSDVDGEDIVARLKLFEAIRLKRASAIQVFSNAGQDEAEKVRERARPYMPQGVQIPTTPAEYMEHNFRYDVLKEAKTQMEGAKEIICS